MIVHAHLTFNGNCRQAMTFYQKCLGGEVLFQTVGESPLSDKLPTRMKNCIVQSTLIKNDLVLMGSDMVSESGLIKGNAVALSLRCSNEEETKAVYGKLSRGGKAKQPLQPNLLGILVGGVTDRYGNHWLLTCDQSNFP
jgi:PhnB protein